MERDGIVSAANGAKGREVLAPPAPDLGTTGSLPTQQLLSVLRTHEVIGVQTNDIREISVTRAASTWPCTRLSCNSPRAVRRASLLIFI